MNGGYLIFEGAINQSMARKSRLLCEMRRDDYCFKHLTTTAWKDLLAHVLHTPVGRCI